MARELGVKHPTLLAWEKRESVPVPELRRAIAVYTAGEVTEETWPESARERRLAAAAERVVPFAPTGTDH